ncbi:MAG: helix-turn-helix domain-containing protein [Methanoculleus sp.]
MFEAGLAGALQKGLTRRGWRGRDLAAGAGIPAATLYKLTSGRVDPRLSTAQRIVDAPGRWRPCGRRHDDGSRL